MKSYKKFLLFSVTLIFQGVTATTLIAEEQPGKTLSPYFIVKGTADDRTEELPLKSSSAKVKIAGTIADVVVNQVYKNQGTTPLEATYVFPGSTKSAIYGMKMTIGDRVRIAQIKERQAAQKAYDTAKAEGKSASLLEQKRPNVFQMSVANIMPGDEIKVELSYTEHLVPTDGIYEFVYPTVVGPRYSNSLTKDSPPSEHWVDNPYLKEGESVPYTFALNLSIDGAVPIQDLLSTSHDISTKFENTSRAVVQVKNPDGGNRDFILHYRLQGAAIQTGMLLTESEGEKFFLLMAQPPQRLTQEAIPPRDYTFVVDVSGSMIGFPLEVTKKLLSNLLNNLKPTDTFNILLFSGGSELLSPSPLPATKENLTKAIVLLDKQNGGGGTELLPALQRALTLSSAEGTSRSIIVVTDGYVDVEKEALELIRTSLGKANLFMFGIGSSVNRYLIEALAHAGQGEPFVVTNDNEAKNIAQKFKKYIESPVMTNLKVEFDGFDVYDTEPLSLPDLFADRPVVIFGKYRGESKGKIHLRGKNGATTFLQEINMENVSPHNDNAALRYLWARKRIERLSDYSKVAPSESITGEITKLGLTYHLLTTYTSFVAVDEVVRNPQGKQTLVKQPLPLPQGVSNNAVGNWGEIGTGPEPETYALLLTLFLMVAVATLHPKVREALERTRK